VAAKTPVGRSPSRPPIEAPPPPFFPPVAKKGPKNGRRFNAPPIVGLFSPEPKAAKWVLPGRWGPCLKKRAKTVGTKGLPCSSDERKKTKYPGRCCLGNRPLAPPVVFPPPSPPWPWGPPRPRKSVFFWKGSMSKLEKTGPHRAPRVPPFRSGLVRAGPKSLKNDHTIGVRIPREIQFPIPMAPGGPGGASFGPPKNRDLGFPPPGSRPVFLAGARGETCAPRSPGGKKMP